MRAIAAATSRAAVLLLLLQLASAYYLPGTYPQEFRVGDPLHGMLIHSMPQ